MSSSRPNARDPLSTIGAIVALGAVSVASFNIQPMYLGALADHLRFSAEQLGLIAGAEVAGSALAGIAATQWVRRWPWRRMALLALMALVTGNTVSALISDFGTLIAVRFMTGFFGIGTGYALAIAALSDTVKTERNFSIAIVAQVILAMIGFTWLPSAIGAYGVAAVFLPLAIISLLMIPSLRYLPPTGLGRATPVNRGAVAPRAAIWLALGCQFFWYLGLGGVWAFVERIGAQAGISPQEVGNALALGMFVGLGGALMAAVIGNRFGRVLPFALAMLGQVIAITLLRDLQSPPLLIFAICLYNGSWNFALPYLFATAAMSDSSGKRVVLMSTAQAVGLTLGAATAGMVIGQFGLVAVTYQGAGSALGALAAFLILAFMLHRAQQH